MFGKSERHTLKNRKRGNRSLKKIAGVVLRLLGLLLLGAAALYIWDSAQDPNAPGAFRLKQTHFQGNDHVDTRELERLIHLSFPENVLLIDLTRLRSLVESEPWVKSAVVRRRLPNALYIYIQERTPVALAAVDGELYLVDSEGVFLDHYGPRYQAFDKPVVKGLKNVARENAASVNRERMSRYLELTRELSQGEQDYTATLSEVDVADPQRLAVVPSSEPVPIYLGDRDFRRRYEIFLQRRDLFEELRRQYGSIESVDVTYEGKIIFHTPDPADRQSAGRGENSLLLQAQMKH